MKDILIKIMNIFKKIFQWIGIIKKNKKLSSFDGITPMPHLTKDDIDNDNFEKSKNDGEQNKEQVDVPPINIVPIPNLDKDKIDIDKFDEEVKKSENTDEINEKIQKEIPPINIVPIPNIPVDKVKVKKTKTGTKRKVVKKENK